MRPSTRAAMMRKRARLGLSIKATPTTYSNGFVGVPPAYDSQAIDKMLGTLEPELETLQAMTKSLSDWAYDTNGDRWAGETADFAREAFASHRKTVSYLKELRDRLTEFK